MPKAPAKKARPSKAEQTKETAPSNAVLDELLKATGETAPSKDEALDSFATRVCTAMAKISDDVFNALSADARKWYEESLEALNESKPLTALPGMPGFVDAAAQESSSAPATAKSDEQKEPEKEEVEVATKQTKGKGKTKAAAKPNGNGGNGKARAPRTDSVAFQVRQSVVKHPEITFDAVVKKLELKGADASPTGHAHNMYQHAKNVMAIAVSEGYVKK